MRFLNVFFAVLVICAGAWGYADRMERQTLDANREPLMRCCDPVPNPLPEGCKCKNCKCGDKVVILDCFVFCGNKFFVSNKTETIFDGKPTPWFDIPDLNTEPVEVGIDLTTNIVTKIVYVTKKEAI